MDSVQEVGLDLKMAWNPSYLNCSMNDYVQTY